MISVCSQVDGPTRGGFLVFQAHAGERPPRHPSHGNAPCKKEIVFTHEWVGPTSNCAQNYFFDFPSLQVTVDEVLGKTELKAGGGTWDPGILDP